MEISSHHSPLPTTYVSPFLSTITTNFPIVPGSAYIQGGPHINVCPPPPISSIQNQQSVGETLQTYQGGSPTPISPTMPIQSISPLPEVRRESQGDMFIFPHDIPAPRAFADGDSLEGKEYMVGIKEVNHEDIEVRIQSSVDNLVDPDEEEAYIAEEKSISDIISSMDSSLNTSIDIEDLDNQEEGERRGQRLPPEGQDVDDDDNEEEEEENKTEKDSGDSEGTDDTVREKRKENGLGTKEDPSSNGGGSDNTESEVRFIDEGDDTSGSDEKDMMVEEGSSPDNPQELEKNIFDSSENLLTVNSDRGIYFGLL